MAHSHEHFDQLAVGHVMGGLDPVDAAEFRSHLVGCRVCRRRVAELRDLDVELAAAEREERAAARLKTEVIKDAPPDGSDEGWWRRKVSSSFFGFVLGLVILVGLALWNLQLRENQNLTVSTAETQGEIIRLFAELEPVEVDIMQSGVSAKVSADDVRYVASMTGVPALATGERVVAWLETPTGWQPGQERAVIDGKTAFQGLRSGATELVVSIVSDPLADEPGDRVLLRARLDVRLAPRLSFTRS